MAKSQQLTIEQALSRAKKATKQGNTTVALELYTAILAHQPNHPIAKKRLSKLQKESPLDRPEQVQTKQPPQDQINALANLYQSGQMAKTEETCRELLQTYSHSLSVMTLLAAALSEQGKSREAIQAYNRVVQFKPNFAEAYNNRGNALKELNQLKEALADYDKAIQLEPDFAEAYSNRGAVLQKLGRLQEAVQSYDKAIQLKPDFAVAFCNHGNALRDLGRLDEAMQNYDNAIQLNPDSANVYYNRGNALGDLGRRDEAMQNYDKAIQLKPDFTEAYNNLGNALKDFERLDEAMRHYDKAIQLKPDFAEAYSNRGAVLKELYRLQEAVTSCDKAIQLKPVYAEAYNHRGNALGALGRLDEAMQNYDKAIQLKPDYLKAYSNFLMTLNYIPNHNAIDHIAMARKFGEIATEKAQIHFSTYQCLPMPERLRVGFVSGDLRNHPVGYFLESILTSIDTSKIELIAYPTTSKVDVLSERIKPSFSKWRPIYGQTDEAAAKLIYADGIHVLIDLSGHTAHNRLAVFSCRPSPVQVSWLGYFATTGLNEMDYLMGDPHVTPPQNDDQFSEKVWRLPETRWCFTPPDVDVDVSAPPALKQGYITFGCFNNTTKVNDKVVELWVKVLDAIPDSRLLLKAKQFPEQLVRESIIQRFSALGIDTKRIILEEPEGRQQYFAAYNRIDITLDPFPFSGGTTSVESLWMGVPLITLAGNSLVSRQSVGVLTNAGLPDWIAEDEESYLTKVISFASDLDKLARLRANLRSQVLASPLFDASRFARNFEHALLEMWNQCANQRQKKHP